MTIQEIIRGESQNVEFKEMLPKNSEKYIKTIIAFANTQGGQLIVGIDDERQWIVFQMLFRIPVFLRSSRILNFRQWREKPLLQLPSHRVQTGRII